MDILNHTIIKYIIMLLLPLCYQSLFAEELAKNKNTYLAVSRVQLNLAFENYNKGDIAASKNNLEHASDWLNKAVEHSHSETIKVQAQKLAESIDSFRLTLNKSSQKSDITRFWHLSTSLIKRESEHLIHSYNESSTNNEIMKYLLDAKMHFYNAEYDLFISHNTKNVNLELRKSLEYLSQAENLAKSNIKESVNHLITNINELISLSDSNKNAWKQASLIYSLEKAISNLSEAESVASSSTGLRIESIKKTISKLKQHVLKRSLKVKYDLIMADFRRSIVSK